MTKDHTKAERDEMRIWQEVLADPTRSPDDHVKAKAALERLNIQGPWAKLRDLEARVEAIEKTLKPKRPMRAPPAGVNPDRIVKKAAKPPTHEKPPTVTDDLNF